MNLKRYYGRLLTVLLLVCTFHFSHAQCPTGASFVIKESRCKENGAITINVTPAGTYTYEIISGPEIAALSNSNVFTGLGAGNYVIAVYGASCSANYAATVPGTYQDPGLLTVDSTDPVICPGGTGCITVKQPTQGRNPYRYEIIAGPVTKPIQSSPKFCGLTPGNYTIQSYDSCGVVRTSTFDLGVDTGDVYGWAVGWDLRYTNCNDFIVPVDYGYFNTNSHDQLRVWYVTPTGDTLKVSDFHTISRYGASRRDTLAGYSRTYGTWQVLIYDECGRIEKSTFDHNQATYAGVGVSRRSCNGLIVTIDNNWRFNETVRYIIRRCSDSSIIHNELQVPPSTGWTSAEITLYYDSCYFIETYNGCGDTLRNTFYTGARPAFDFTGCANPSCVQNGKSQATLWYPTGGSLPYTYTILAGPAQVGDSLVATSQWDSWATWGGLTPGMYRFMVRDACGQRDTIDVDASRPLERKIDVLQTPHCSGGSNLDVKVTSNYMPCVYYYWGSSDYLAAKVSSTYPINYTPVNVAITPVSPTTSGTWRGDFINVNEDSLYLRIHNEGGCTFDTMVRINKYVAPTLHDIKGFVCGNSGTATMNYRVLGGLPPFRFRIKPDNSSTWGAWQDSSVFTGLTAGTYDVNIEDACPNGSIRSVSFYTWQKSPVVISTPCATIGNPVTLSADPPINLVAYQWLFNNAVVGTGSSYTIPSYAHTQQGTYKLRQVFRGGACTDSMNAMLLTCSVLPLTFGEFTGEFSNELVKLQWTTLTDIPGSRFIIERSLDGTNFSKIGEVTNLNEFDGSTYRYIDNRPGKKNFYRIGFYTDPGAVYYSNVIKLVKNQLPEEQTQITISPVPFKNKFQLQINVTEKTELSIKLFDVLGKKILEKKVNVTVGNNNIVFSDEVAELNAGYYFIEITGEQLLQRKKILKQ